MSPESGVPCHLERGHAGAHEAYRGAFALASWARTFVEPLALTEAEVQEAIADDPGYRIG